MRGLRYRSDEEQCDTQGSQPFRRRSSCENVHNCSAVRCSIQPKCLNLADYESYREILALEWLSTGAFFGRECPKPLERATILPSLLTEADKSGSYRWLPGVRECPRSPRGA
jgi:hypothetical protein